jgi:hypothetical protein
MQALQGTPLSGIFQFIIAFMVAEAPYPGYSIVDNYVSGPVSYLPQPSSTSLSLWLVLR